MEAVAVEACTRSGRSPNQEDSDASHHTPEALQTPQFTPPKRRGIRCWALPASLAVTGESLLVSFPPLIDMLKFSG